MLFLLHSRRHCLTTGDHTCPVGPDRAPGPPSRPRLQSIQSTGMLRGIDGLRNDDDVELIDVELMSIRGPRAKTRGMDENPARNFP